MVDAGLAVLMFGLTLGMLAAGGLGKPDSHSRGLDALGVVLSAVSVAPLAARRAAPLTVYAVTGVASLTLNGLRYPLDFPFGAVVAAYTVASACGGQNARRRAAAITAVAAFVPATVAIYAFHHHQGSDIVTGLVFWILTFICAWLAGDRSRLRAERIAELEDRVRHTELQAAAERRLAAAEERARIARELHDSAGHAINTILVQAGAARLLHQRDPAGSQGAISVIEQVARGTIDEIDQLVRALRDDEDPGQPLPADPALLSELLDRHRANGLALATRLDGTPGGLPRSVTWAAYRILQEALTNAARHGAGSADVEISYHPEAVEIQVTNPASAGSPGPSPGGGGHGVAGMRERAALLGGVLQTGARDGTFRLYARLPHHRMAP